MSNLAESMPAAAANSNSIGEGTRKRDRRAVTVGFLTVIAIAMFGWLTGLGWAMISVAKWLLD